MHHLANRPLLSCHPGNHKMSYTGRTEAAGGSAGGPAIPRPPPRMLRLLLRALSHPLVGAPETGRRHGWVGTAMGGVQRWPSSWLFWSHPTLGALRRGLCLVSLIFFSFWLKHGANQKSCPLWLFQTEMEMGQGLHLSLVWSQTFGRADSVVI